MEDNRSLQELAQEALAIQNACNLSGLVHSFSQSISRLRQLYPTAGTTFINKHPITVLWVDKLKDLSGAYGERGKECWPVVERIARQDIEKILS